MQLYPWQLHYLLQSTEEPGLLRICVSFSDAAWRCEIRAMPVREFVQRRFAGVAPALPGCKRIDEAAIRRKASRTMKNLYSNVVASFLALAVVAGVSPAMASSLNDAQPQCGDDKKESKGGDKKDDKSNDTKPKPPVQG